MKFVQNLYASTIAFVPRVPSSIVASPVILPRVVAVLIVLSGIVMAPASAVAQSKRCLDSNCLNSRQVRDFEVIDRGTLIVYVGRERCPYKIEVSELFCDLTYLPDVAFISVREWQRNSRAGNSDLSIPGPGGSSNQLASTRRVCSFNASQFALESFSFADIDPGGSSQLRPPCEIRDISVVTDNDLVELYVDENLLPPPPPVGNGEISRAEDAAREVQPEPEAD